MPIYEYYCSQCDEVFEALRSLWESERPLPCPNCQGDAQRIMPTSFVAMSWRQGYKQRVPYYHRPLFNRPPRFDKPVAPVKNKTAKQKIKRARS